MTTNLNLRLPDDLHGRLKALGKRDYRSLNGEIVALLEQAVPLAEAAPGREDPGPIPNTIAAFKKLSEAVKTGNARLPEMKSESVTRAD